MPGGLLARPTVRVLLAGGVVGLGVLGVGGRVAMALIRRGLRGTPNVGRWYFLPLVAVYGVALQWLTSRWATGRNNATQRANAGDAGAG